MNKLVVFLMLLLLLTSGCGSRSQDPANEMAVENSQFAFDMDSEDTKSTDAGSAADESSGEPFQPQTDRKIIQNAEISMSIDDIEQAAEKIKQETLSLEGYILDYSVHTSETNTSAHLSLKVPEKNYAQLVAYIIGQGKKEYHREYTNDVTAEYIDLDARVMVLKAEEESLLSILTKADKIDDILKIKQQITATRQERESLERRLKALQNSVSYASIVVILNKPKNSEITVDVENLNIFSRSGRALIYGFNLLTARLGDIIVAIFTILPTLFLFLLVIFPLIYVRRKRKNKHIDNKLTE